MQDEKKLFPGFITIFDSLGKKNALVNLELKNMNKIEGEIVEVDQNLNFALKNVKVIIEDKNKSMNFNVTNINRGKVQESNEIIIEFESYYSKDLLTNEITDYYDDLISNVAISICKKYDIDINF